MKTIKVPIYFGTPRGDEIGEGNIEQLPDKTIVTLEINHPERENVVDLLANQLVGFAMVYRPAFPTPIERTVDAE
jgi:hypothetical protein